MLPRCENCGSADNLVIVPVRVGDSMPPEYLDTLVCETCLESPASADEYGMATDALRIAAMSGPIEGF